MLTQTGETSDLKGLYEELLPSFPEEVQQYAKPAAESWNLRFPVNKTPEKVKSLNIEKEENYQGRLVGIKGQYLLFEDERVFNVRSNEGTVIGLNIYN